MFNVKALLGGFPEIIQYVIVIGIILVLLYVSLLVTRILGSKSNSEKVYFDDPDAYDKSVPDLFAATALKRKKAAAEAKAKAEENKTEES